MRYYIGVGPGGHWYVMDRVTGKPVEKIVVIGGEYEEEDEPITRKRRRSRRKKQQLW